MKRWFLPFAQLVVGLAMIPQGVLFGALVTVPTMHNLLSGLPVLPVASDGRFYWSATLAASFSVDVAIVLCLLAAAFLIRKPSRRGLQFSIAGAICYWIYVVGHLLMISALPGGFRGGLTLLDAVDYPIGIIAAAVAIALFLSSHDRMREGLGDASRRMPIE